MKERRVCTHRVHPSPSRALRAPHHGCDACQSFLSGGQAPALRRCRPDCICIRRRHSPGPSRAVDQYNALLGGGK